jgi:hypothetical protein
MAAVRPVEESSAIIVPSACGDEPIPVAPGAPNATERSCEPAGDKQEKDFDPNLDNDGPLLDRILAVDIEVSGKWKGFTWEPFDKSTVEIKKDEKAIGKYRLYFDRRTSCGSCQWHEIRTATYADGVFTLNKKIDGFGGTEGHIKCSTLSVSTIPNIWSLT